MEGLTIRESAEGAEKDKPESESEQMMRGAWLDLETLSANNDRLLRSRQQLNFQDEAKKVADITNDITRIIRKYPKDAGLAGEHVFAMAHYLGAAAEDPSMVNLYIQVRDDAKRFCSKRRT